MFIVVATYLDAEIAIGEGATYPEAAAECNANIPAMYPPEDVILECTHGVLTVETPLALWRAYH